MMTEDDHELLRRYARDKSQPAFAELVRRYVDLVYSAALRRTRDAHLADDVTQATFLLFSQKAPRPSGTVHLPGWLYTTALLTARTAMRTQHRRQKHERAAAAGRPETSPSADA